MPRRGSAKAMVMRMGAKRRRTHEDRDLPGFAAPRAGKHTKIAGRGRHKAKKG